ncbi:unnamed protein product [Periconia digitata]|uniref:Uncharacterized protein n=1 Tax=Periconia digitata TaxID=1303443 RepID=A0A9W4XQV0_9PLEO|nr:unnamed protein product [Periconia digitata]
MTDAVAIAIAIAIAVVVSTSKSVNRGGVASRLLGRANSGPFKLQQGAGGQVIQVRIGEVEFIMVHGVPFPKGIACSSSALQSSVDRDGLGLGWC